MAMRESVALDVSHLPTCAFGHRDPLWWGIVLAIAIETTGFAIAWATYLYLRMQEATWPPWGWSAPNLMVGAISTAVILATAVPMYLLDKESKRMNVSRVRFLLIVFYAISLVACAIRVWEFIALQVKWDSNAYGSIVWALLTLHTVHLVTSLAEAAILAVYIFIRPMDERHALDLEVTALYWYFVVGSWIPNAILLYLGPHILN
jgi:cytochrome c oxidase subunit III